MLNQVQLQGRLAKDPEFRKTRTNVSYCSFTLVVERPKTATSDKINDYIPCIAWGNTADFICKWFTKGDMVVVSGTMQSREYSTGTGKTGIAYEVRVNECNFTDNKNTRKRVFNEKDDYEQIDWDKVPNKPDIY